MLHITLWSIVGYLEWKYECYSVAERHEHCQDWHGKVSDGSQIMYIKVSFYRESGDRKHCNIHKRETIEKYTSL